MTVATKIPVESGTTKPKVTSTKTAKQALAKVASLGKDLADALTTEPQPAAPPATRQMIQLALSQIVDSPENPREDVGDVKNLAVSIKSAGLLQPVLVAPAAAYRAGNGQMPDANDEGKFVLIAGHRRVAACRLLKLTHVDAVVEPSKVGTAARKAMIIENFQRVDLTPIEEARAFAELDTLGVKQDEIALEVGCSQSHISKRLALLKLDDQVQAAVVSKEITIADAVEVAKLPEALQVAAMQSIVDDDWSARQAVDNQLRQAKIDEQKAKSRDELRARKADELTRNQMHDLFGYQHYQFELPAAEIKKHNGFTCLVARIDDYDGKLKYYCKAKKKCAAYPKAAERVDPELERKRLEREQNKQRKAATDARAPFAQKLEAMGGTDAALLEDLLPYLAGDRMHGWAARSYQAVAWMTANGIGGLEPYAKSTYGLLEYLRTRDDSAKLIRRLVRSAMLAGHEIRLADKYQGPKSAFQSHVIPYYAALVQRVAYSPTEWELAQLKAYAGIEGDVMDHLTKVRVDG